MKRCSKLIVVALAIVLFSSCWDRKPPVIDYRRFLESEALGISLESDMLFDMMLNGTIACDDNDVIVFGRKQMSRIYGYRLSTDSLMLLDSSDIARSYCPVLNAISLDSIWYIRKGTGGVGALCNTANNSLLYSKSELPFYGNKYCIVAHNCFPVANGHFYTEILATDTSLHLTTLDENKIFNHWPKVAEWRINGDSLELVRLFCQYPYNYPATEYEDFLPNIYYNPIDSVFILASGDSRVWLFDLKGNPLGERRLVSQMEQPKEPFPITKGSYNYALNWYANNSHYGSVIFDPYRNVYLRVIAIPASADKDAMVRTDKERWVLVVADRDFNVKYEVLFDDNKYEWRLIMPTEKGVYIAQKKGDNYEEPSLFVFY